MDHYNRNRHFSGSWDHRFTSSSAYDYLPPRTAFLERRGSAPSGKYHSIMSSSPTNRAGLYSAGGTYSDLRNVDTGPMNSHGLNSHSHSHSHNLHSPTAKDNARTNLIVNYLPQTMTEKELFSLFISFGPIDSCKVMKDFKTGYSYGFGFVNFVREDDAAAAVSALNGIAVQNKRLKVSYARPAGDDIKETNLYVTNLPKDITDNRLEVIFGKYGRIVQKNILRDKMSGFTRGIAFVRYDKREEAQEAISALNNVIPEGGSEPLTVRIAEEHGKQKAAYYMTGSGWPNMGSFPPNRGNPNDCPPVWNRPPNPNDWPVVRNRPPRRFNPVPPRRWPPPRQNFNDNGPPFPINFPKWVPNERVWEPFM